MLCGAPPFKPWGDSAVLVATAECTWVGVTELSVTLVNFSDASV